MSSEAQSRPPARYHQMGALTAWPIRAYKQTDRSVRLPPVREDESAGLAKEGGESAMKRMIAVGLMVAAAVVPFTPEILGVNWG
jgi:hypothetical protein